MAAFAIAAAVGPRGSWRALAAIGVVCAVLPDLDALPRLLGHRDFAEPGGHRGITHSILFALGIASVAAMTTSHRLGVSGRRMFLFVALVTLSHGVLDAFSDFGSGLGVAFLAPFSEHRFTAPWQPIAGEFSELLVCLLPLALIGTATLRLRQLSLGVQLRERPVQLGLQTLECRPPDRPLQPTSGAERQADAQQTGKPARG
jgi:inner membrane protein